MVLITMDCIKRAKIQKKVSNALCMLDAIYAEQSTKIQKSLLKILKFSTKHML